MSSVTLPEQDRSFADIWRMPGGLAAASAVNQTAIGKRYVVTGFVFFLVGGVLALVMRAQLAFPEGQLLDHAAYNRLFTMHGTTMMFLFAVPIVEGMAVYLVPLMLGARDLAFPRLSALGYWCYLFGGILLYSSFLVGHAPDAGWFMYTPLSGPEFSPGPNVDFWLLGVTFAEISAVAAAVELVVSILKTRAPGMSVDRMPLLAWYMLVVALMIVAGFPPLILGSVLLELERAFHLPFYDPALGGNPLTWQHLFWIFGHPEVYIIFLPAAGFVSMIVPTFAQRPIAGYPWIVLAAAGTGFVSMGLWVHHMFTTGLPGVTAGLFSAASMTVSVLSGIQVFAWIATLWNGRPVLRTPLLFVAGFIVTFVLGGLTGVMVAVVPFDWQVHDSYFVVAHFHYVLIGGMVFPLFAAFHYWLPLATGRMLSERLGRWNFWVMFAGFNLAFFPMHLSGLLGMPRRVYTYPTGLGWDTPNLWSTVGAFLFAVGVLLFVGNFLWSRRHGAPAGHNPWNAGTLEWATRAPVPGYNFRSIPRVESRYPLWDQPRLVQDIEEGRGLLAGAASNLRLTIGSSPTGGETREVIVLPKPTYLPLLAALALAVFFVGFLVKQYAWAAGGAAAALAVFVAWAWLDPMREQAGDVALARQEGITLRPQGPAATAWWGLVVTLVADGMLFASLLFAYFLTWASMEHTPPLRWQPHLPAAAALAALLVAGAAAWAARRAMDRDERRPCMRWTAIAAVAAAAVVASAAWAAQALPFGPREGALDAMLYAMGGYMVVHAAIGLVMVLLALARGLQRTGDAALALQSRITALFLYYTAATGAMVCLLLLLRPSWT